MKFSNLKFYANRQKELDRQYDEISSHIKAVLREQKFYDFSYTWWHLDTTKWIPWLYRFTVSYEIWYGIEILSINNFWFDPNKEMKLLGLLSFLKKLERGF